METEAETNSLECVLRNWENISKLEISAELLEDLTVGMVKDNTGLSLKINGMTLAYNLGELNENPEAYIARQTHNAQKLLSWASDNLSDDREMVAQTVELVIEDEWGDSMFPPILMNAYRSVARVVYSVYALLAKRKTLHSSLKLMVETHQAIGNAYQILAELTEDGAELLERQNGTHDVSELVSLSKELGTKFRYLGDTAHSMADACKRKLQFFYSES